VTLDERWQKVQRLLALRLDNLGDVLMTGPALRALRQALPQASLTLMVSPAGQEAAALLPWADRILAWRTLWQDLGDLPFDPAREFHLIRTLRAERFDAAIIFTSFSQSPHVAAYACYLAGIPLRLGEPKDFAGRVLSDMPLTPGALEMHQVDRNLRLLESIGISCVDRSLAVQIPPEAWARAATLLAQHGLPPGAPYLLLCPWTSCQARTYPRFGAAGRLLCQASGLLAVVVGSRQPGDRAASLMRELGPHAIDLVGQTSFATLAALVAGARLVVTNNTATMHLADATLTPQVVLFAGTELEKQWAPRRGPARLLRRPTPCQPCFEFTCPQDLACLAIEPEEVVAEALELLTDSGGDGSPAVPSPLQGEGASPPLNFLRGKEPSYG